MGNGIYYRALSMETWGDFERVMGCNQGGDGGCWCMWWRLPRSQWQGLGRDGRKQAFQDIVASGTPTGIIGYEKETAYGWCAIAPASAYPVIQRSRVAHLTTQAGTWFISCLFIKAGYRRAGRSEALIAHAVDFARTMGAASVEACPRQPGTTGSANELFVGTPGAFLKQGFREVARRSPTRPLMQLDLRLSAAPD